MAYAYILEQDRAGRSMGGGGLRCISLSWKNQSILLSIIEYQFCLDQFKKIYFLRLLKFLDINSLCVPETVLFKKNDRWSILARYLSIRMFVGTLLTRDDDYP